MTVIFSKKCEIGLQSVLYLSTLEREKLVNASEVSDKLKIPKEFVAKVLQILTDSGIVGSRKGKNGGFFLAKTASDVRLIDIVLALDGPSVFSNCVLGFKGCSVSEPCPVHDHWGALRNEAYKMLSTETLEGLKNKTISKIENIL